MNIKYLSFSTTNLSLRKLIFMLFVLIYQDKYYISPKMQRSINCFLKKIFYYRHLFLIRIDIKTKIKQSQTIFHNTLYEAKFSFPLSSNKMSISSSFIFCPYSFRHQKTLRSQYLRSIL